MISLIINIITLLSQAEGLFRGEGEKEEFLEELGRGCEERLG